MSGFAGFRNGLVVALIAGAALLSGCRDDSTASPRSGAPGAPAGSTAPGSTAQTLSLTGTSSSDVKVGQNYSFQPTVAGNTSGSLGFAIQNKPAWASFNTATGALSGTPTSGHVGTYANIVISASSSTGAVGTLAAFSISVTPAAAAATGSATLSWTAPTQNTDGSTLSNLAGYRIYYGATAGALSNSINVTNPGLTTYTVANLGSGTHYFGITAYTTGGVESGISNIGSKTVM